MSAHVEEELRVRVQELEKRIQRAYEFMEEVGADFQRIAAELRSCAAAFRVRDSKVIVELVGLPCPWCTAFKVMFERQPCPKCWCANCGHMLAEAYR